MLKIGQFIYPWGGGHYSRMMRLDAELPKFIRGEFEVHYSSKDHVYQKLLERFPDSRERIHEVLMPTPIDGRFGPSLSMSMLNVLVPVGQNRSIISQIAHYLRQERALYDREMFDLVINDGDMGSNVLAERRGIHSLFVTNQFMPKLYRTRSYLYPSVRFVARQIAKASQILVADSPPPHCICEYNLNFTKDVMEKVSYVGHFAGTKKAARGPATHLEELVQDAEFGYWMRTGNKSTNDGTGERYEEAFARDEMKNERRIISHARNDPSIDAVTDRDGKRHTMQEALEKKVDWVQVDVGFLSEQELGTVLERCRYAVVNGSHTVMGEILGGVAKPIIGMPVYDEHTNNIRWADERGLGVLARSAGEVAAAISRIREDYDGFAGRLAEFSSGFVAGGAARTAEIAAAALDR